MDRFWKHAEKQRGTQHIRLQSNVAYRLRCLEVSLSRCASKFGILKGSIHNNKEQIIRTSHDAGAFFSQYEVLLKRMHGTVRIVPRGTSYEVKMNESTHSATKYFYES